MEMIENNWLLILLVVLIAALIGWYVFHAARRTRVTGDRRDVLDEGATPAARNQALIDAPTAATPPMPVAPATPAGLAGAGEAVSVGAERQQVAAGHAAPEGDDLTRLKGVGPKLVTRLAELGVTRFAQIAAWSEADIDRIDAQLGRFAGRIRRDAWVEQAKLLMAGNEAAYAAKFGNIT
jgi:predicted flap endonuclease-1-like 5' DNA nuclease